MDGAGWPEEASDLLQRLEGDPSPAVLQAHREEHDRLIRQPMQRLSDALGVVGGYDLAWPTARSSKPMTWQRTGASVWIARRVHITAVFDLDGLLVEGGWTSNGTDQLWRYRAVVDDDRIGRELVVHGSAADRIAVLHRSRIVEIGSGNNFVAARGRYANLWQALAGPHDATVARQNA